MTRKQGTSRAVRRAPVRAKRKTRPARTALAKPIASDPFDNFIAAAARSLDLNVARRWMPGVRGHLQAILRHGALVAGFPLPDESEPAPVFRA